MMMRILSSHKNIIADEAYPLEYPALTAAIFKDEDIVQRYFNGVAPSVEESINIYKQMAQESGKNAIYFAEKLPSWRQVENILSAAPLSKFVGIVRDPRDVLVSVKAFNKKNNSLYGFQVIKGDDDHQTVDRYCALYDKFVRIVDLTNAHVVKYEDVIERPVDTVMSMFDSIGLETCRNTVQEIVDRANKMEDGRHRTSAEGSIERWREGMPLALRELYKNKLGYILERYAYQKS
jgi:Sulfotransferase family